MPGRRAKQNRKAVTERGNTPAVPERERQGEFFPGEIRVSRVSTTFSGPIPLPTHLREYEQVLPGSADRIVTMAEAEAHHRRTSEGRLIRLSEWGLLAALLIALVGMIGGLYVTLRGKSLEGMGTIGVTIVALVTVFALRKEPPGESD
ncbi:MAG TPA: DUF2335 domain-containing protein [Longimicrobium sp.]|jgi:uncharacterized membrane protein